jgi:hypothetical protein
VGPRAILDAVVKRKIPSIPTKFNLYFSNSPTTDLIVPTLQRLLTFQVLNLMSFFHCLGHAKESVQVRGALKYSVKRIIFMVRGLAPHPTFKLEDHSLSAVRDCLFSLFAATFHIWRPSFHPQPEDAPCHGDKGPA